MSDSERKDLDIMARKKDVELYAVNPFVGELAGLKTRKKRVTVKGGMAVIDGDGVVVEDTVEINAVHHVDNEQFVKVFTSNLKHFFNLKPSTFKMVQVLLYQLGKRPQQDSVYLNMSVAEQYFSESGQPSVSRATFHASVKEMIQKGFLAESTNPNLYWINPTLFFNGDRVRFVKEYRKIGTDQRQLALDEPTDLQQLLMPSPEKEEA